MNTRAIGGGGGGGGVRGDAKHKTNRRAHHCCHFFICSVCVCVWGGEVMYMCVCACGVYHGVCVDICVGVSV